VAQETVKEENESKEGKVMVTKTKEQVSIEEKLNKVDLSNNLQKPRLISISSKLTKEEKISLV